MSRDDRHGTVPSSLNTPLIGNRVWPNVKFGSGRSTQAPMSFAPMTNRARIPNPMSRTHQTPSASQIRKISELRQTGTCRGDVNAPKTEFPDHAKLMPTNLTTQTSHEAPTARECGFEAPTTPGSSEVVRTGGIGNRRRVVGDRGLNTKGQRGFFGTTIVSRLERQEIVVASGRYRKQPTNQ